MRLDRAEEAILICTGPPPRAEDVMAAYNARAHATLLRGAAEVAIRCAASPAELRRALGGWPAALGVDARIERESLLLYGRPDATGSWARHGRRVERAALELLASPALSPREVRGQLTLGERACRFRWEGETLTLLGADRFPGGADATGDDLPERVVAVAAALRRAREEGARLSIRRATHLVGVEGGVCLPHLELRDGDDGLYLRVAGPEALALAGESIRAFHGKTPLALVSWSATGEGRRSAAPAKRCGGARPRICWALCEARRARRLNLPRDFCFGSIVLPIPRINRCRKERTDEKPGHDHSDSV
jgi:hypothetical protein